MGSPAPSEPPSCQWAWPDLDSAELTDTDLVAVGADLEPGTILDAYRHGIFPMPVRDDTLGWWSPLRRAVMPLDSFRPSRSLRRSQRKFEIRVDSAFDEVIRACADPARPHGWITDEIVYAYTRLHELGWVHSVEAFAADDGSLAGGLYGVSVGGLFAAESMFHRRTDAGKVALAALVEALLDDFGHGGLLDVQWLTPHLASLGAVEIGRADYLAQLRAARRG